VATGVGIHTCEDHEDHEPLRFSWLMARTLKRWLPPGTSKSSPAV
jgi:hypothetical protein